MSSVPYVIEEGNRREERVYDLFSRLLKDRIIFVGDDFTPELSNSVIAQLLFLEAEDSEKDVSIYINSDGGLVTSCLSIYDVMNYIKPNVSTLCIGSASSAAAFILSAGTPGKRFALKNSRIMMHQVSGGYSGNIQDLEIYAKNMNFLNNILLREWSKITKRTVEQLKQDINRDYYMSPEEAIEYGVIDEVLTK